MVYSTGFDQSSDLVTNIENSYVISSGVTTCFISTFEHIDLAPGCSLTLYGGQIGDTRPELVTYRNIRHIPR